MALAAHIVHLEFVVRFHLTDDLCSVTEWVGGVHAYFDRSQSDGIEVAPGLLAVWGILFSPTLWTAPKRLGFVRNAFGQRTDLWH